MNDLDRTETQRQWRLTTANSEYVVSLLPDGNGLVLDHWGRPVAGDVDPWWNPDRFYQKAVIPDSAPLEYASAGHRHVGFSELLVDRGDSLTGALFHCADPDSDARFDSDASGSRLVVTFTDETGDLRLTLITVTSSTHDVVTRGIRLENRSAERTVTLPRAFSAGWPLPVGPTARVNYFAGNWGQEFNAKSVDLDGATLSVGSRSGITSFETNPVMVVESSVPGLENEAFGVALAWSGSWRLQAESTTTGDRVRVSGGIDDDTTTITLLPGESFESPWSLGAWSKNGREGVSQAWHEYQRGTLARTLDEEHRPIVFNSWFSTQFDVEVTHQEKLAEVANRLGVEVFVVDDGWFAGRVDETAGLGDWRPDPVKFPQGLGPLAHAVIEKGMRFGLWIEPEAVNPDSDLYRAHPDWVYRAGNRPLITRRDQYVLDLGRQDVVSWIEDTFRTLLSDAPISYLKWDMNRPVSDGGRPGDPHGRQWSIQHTAGYYRVLRMLRTEFPHVTIETCAGGGGRIDNGSLALSDVVWPSDGTGPRDRLMIQDGFLSAYPQHTMSSWVTDERGLLDRSEVSFEFRFVVAMAGVLGIGSDLLGWSERQIGRAAEMVNLYKSIRQIIHTGVVTRHGRPTDDVYAIEYSDPKDGSGSVCLLVWGHDRGTRFDGEETRVRPARLVADAAYRIRGTSTVLEGANAMSRGIVIPFGVARDTDVVIFDRV